MLSMKWGPSIFNSRSLVLRQLADGDDGVRAGPASGRAGGAHPDVLRGALIGRRCRGAQTAAPPVPLLQGGCRSRRGRRRRARGAPDAVDHR